METHVWHAKRMRMTTKWGYKLPLHPNDKSIRATYRFSKVQALVQDVSYTRSIELLGDRYAIIKTMDSILKDPFESGVGSERFITGNRYGNATAYHHNSLWPTGCIGPVEFLWKQDANAEENQASLFLFVHPSSFASVLDSLTKCAGNNGIVYSKRLFKKIFSFSNNFSFGSRRV